MKKYILMLILTLTVLTNVCFGDFFIQPYVGLNKIPARNEIGCSVIYNPGIYVGSSFGYKFRKHFAIEEEIFLHYNSFDCLKVEGYELTGDGNISSYGVFSNVIYRCPYIYDQVCLYIGVGCGYDWVIESISLDPIYHDGDIYSFPQHIERANGVCVQGKVGVEIEYKHKIMYSFEYDYIIGSSSISNHTLCCKLKRYL